eukprot:9346842-Heterocapsa_arctica.AAC.1
MGEDRRHRRAGGDTTKALSLPNLRATLLERCRYSPRRWHYRNVATMQLLHYMLQEYILPLALHAAGVHSTSCPT